MELSLGQSSCVQPAPTQTLSWLQPHLCTFPGLGQGGREGAIVATRAPTPEHLLYTGKGPPIMDTVLPNLEGACGWRG